MKKFSEKRKEFIIAAAIVMTMLLPMTTNAQTKMDGFFEWSGDDNYSNRDTSVSGDFINAHNQSFGDNAPLGSGLLIMVATGLGYALLKKKGN